MKVLNKSIILLLIILFCTITLSSCQSSEGESTITIMEQDEQDNRNIEEDTSADNQQIPEDNSSLDFNDEDSEIIYNDVPKNNTSSDTDTPKVIELLPEAKVILPIRRKDTSHTELNIAPCGGVEKRKADTLTNRGSIINVIWEIVNPAPQANCTVKLSPGLDEESNFTALYPNDLVTDNTGSFPCGRTKGFESQQFKLPDDYVCDQCTLQWAWHTDKGILYSCSDIIINGNRIENCLAKCQNGGACFNGKCLCKEGFYGEYCEYSSMIIFFLLFYRH
jgi:hypothetical protein